MKVMSTPYETAGARPRRPGPEPPWSLRPVTSSPPASRRRSRTPPRPRRSPGPPRTATSPTSGRCWSPRTPRSPPTSMLPANPPQDPAARLDAVVANFSAMILDTEAQQRTMLRLSLEADAAERDALPAASGTCDRMDRRGARRRPWRPLRPAVPPARAQHPRHHRYRSDRVARRRRRPSRNDAVALTRWSAQALLQRATTVPPPAPSRSGRHGPRSTARIGPVSNTPAEPRSTRP